MPPHDNVENTDSENDQTVWEDIHVDVEEPMDEDTPEEEPSEHEEESEPEDVSEGSEPEEVPSTPVASPAPPPPPQSYQAYMASLSRSDIAHQDPYLPPPQPLPTILPRVQWAWIRRLIGLWRREEGDTIPEVSHTPTMTPTCPITEEPTHLTIPLLVARLYRHENRLHELIEARRNQPNPDLPLQVNNELRLLRNEHRELCDEMVTYENTTTRRINNLELDVLRLQGLDEEVRDLRRMVAEMTLQHRDGAGPSSRNGSRQ